MPRERFLYLPVGIVTDELQPTDSRTYRPVLLASVSTPASAAIKVACLLDSGADHCLLPAHVAARLGLELASMPRGFVSGVGNAANEVSYTTVNFEIGRGLSFEARVGFCKALDREGIGVLGQMGFFDRFHVEFRLADGFFTVEPATISSVQ